MELPSALFKPKLEKIKNLPPKNFLYFRKWNFLALRLKISYVSGNRTFVKKFLIFQERFFQARKIKKISS